MKLRHSAILTADWRAEPRWWYLIQTYGWPTTNATVTQEAAKPRESAREIRRILERSRSLSHLQNYRMGVRRRPDPNVSFLGTGLTTAYRLSVRAGVLQEVCIHDVLQRSYARIDECLIVAQNFLRSLSRTSVSNTNA